MMPDSGVLAYTKELQACANVEEISRVFERFIAPFSLRYFAINGIPGLYDDIRDLVIINNFPAAWVEEYVRNDYARIDPIVEACRTRTEPFFWSEVAHTWAHDETVRRFMERARTHGLGEGLCIPVRGLNGHDAGISLSAPVLALDRAAIATLHLAGRYAFNHARAVQRNSDAGLMLTAREKEALMWCALGKTSAEIGLHLGISETTVNSHIRRCMAKLEAGNKVEAVATAIREGIIVG